MIIQEILVQALRMAHPGWWCELALLRFAADLLAPESSLVPCAAKLVNQRWRLLHRFEASKNLRRHELLAPLPILLESFGLGDSACSVSQIINRSLHTYNSELGLVASAARAPHHLLQEVRHDLRATC